ncbi:hypothetical protein [Phascolarctobacterium faecium]
MIFTVLLLAEPELKFPVEEYPPMTWDAIVPPLIVTSLLSAAPVSA